MKRLFLFLLVLSSLTSCLSKKQITYFQGEPVSKSELYKLNNEPYRLQVNDILYIDIKAENPEIVALFKNSEESRIPTNSSQNGSALYFTGYSIDRHGNIRIPYIGEMNVLGYTEKEVREKIEEELVNYVKDVESLFVTVKLQGINFVITGEIGSPGSMNLAQNDVTLVDAIASAGDITIYGDRENIEIVRKTIDGVKKYKVDMLNIDVFNSDNYYIQPNDVIYIPPLKQKTWGFGTTGFQTFTTLMTVFSLLTTTTLLIISL